MELTTTREAATNHGLKILVHGPAGAGKTRLCATTGDLEHTLILSAEAGLLSLRDYDIDVAVIKSIADMKSAYSFVRKTMNPEYDGKHYTWVCIDSLSEIAEVCLAYEKDQTANGMRAYGEMADVMFKIIRAFRDLAGINVVFTAKQDRVNDEGRLLYVPLLPGQQLSKGISYLFDEVFAMRTANDSEGNVRRFLQTVNDGTYDAKDRSGALDPAVDPNLHKIATTIHEAGAATGVPGLHTNTSKGDDQ